MSAALHEIREYFEQRADADCDGDPAEYRPNLEMRMLAEVETVERERAELLAALEAVVAVADRKTDVFDRAHAIIARCKGDPP